MLFVKQLCSVTTVLLNVSCCSEEKSKKFVSVALKRLSVDVGRTTVIFAVTNLATQMILNH